MRVLISVFAALGCLSSFAASPAATEGFVTNYVASATNATLEAAKQYADEHGGGGSAPPVVTNIAEDVVGAYDETNLTARIDAKQDALPYPTNAIPAGVVDGLADVATSGSYEDLADKPTIPDAQVQSDWAQTDTNAVDYIRNKPSVPSGQVQSDWAQDDSAEVDFIRNKPEIPGPQVQGDWAQADTNAVDYIKNKPTIPSGQVQVDWEQDDATEVDYIKNKPTLPAPQVQSDWAQTDTASVDYIKNKPSITVPQSEQTWTVDGVPVTVNASASKSFTSLTDAGVSALGYTKNAGTVTGVKVNGTTKAPASGVVDIGDVVTDVTYGYALGTLSGSVRNGEIRSITPISSTLSVSVQLGSSATESADCAIFVNTSSLTFDISLQLSGYTFYGEDGYLLISRGTRTLITFTRISATEVIVSKKEM